MIDDIKAFANECLKNLEIEGKFPQKAKKTALVTARIGEIGEEVDTRPRVERNGKIYVISETKTKVKTENSYIVKNVETYVNR